VSLLIVRDNSNWTIDMIAKLSVWPVTGLLCICKMFRSQLFSYNISVLLNDSSGCGNLCEFKAMRWLKED